MMTHCPRVDAKSVFIFIYPLQRFRRKASTSVEASRAFIDASYIAMLFLILERTFDKRSATFTQLMDGKCQGISSVPEIAINVFDRSRQIERSAEYDCDTIISRISRMKERLRLPTRDRAVELLSSLLRKFNVGVRYNVRILSRLLIEGYFRLFVLESLIKNIFHFCIYEPFSND